MGNRKSDDDKWTIGDVIVAIPVYLLAIVLIICLSALALAGAVVAIFALPLIIIIAVVASIVKG